MSEDSGSSGHRQPPWLLMSSHGLVLFYVATHPDETIRAMSGTLGLTERRVLAIVKDLAQTGLITVEHRGRRNHYRLDPNAHFIHETMSHIRIVDLIKSTEDEASALGREPARAGAPGVEGK